MIEYSYDGNGRADASLPLMTIHAMFYNQSKFAGATLESMLAQTYETVEVVVSDDCSPDGTGEVLLDAARSYAGPHRVVVNVNESNMGIGDHFARVTSLSNGLWHTSLGGDDLAEPDCLQTVSEYAAEYPDAVAIGSAATTIDETDAEIGEAYVVDRPTVYRRYESGPATWSLNPGDDVAVVPVTGCVASYSRRLLDAAPFPKGIMAEDAFLGFRAALVGDVLFIPEKCVRQRINRASVMRAGKHAGSRSERKKFRRRMSAMTFTALNAVLEEAHLLRPDLDAEFTKSISRVVSESLLGSFHLPDPLGRNFGAYKRALAEARGNASLLQVLRRAMARGVLAQTLRLVLKGAMA